MDVFERSLRDRAPPHYGMHGSLPPSLAIRPGLYVPEDSQREKGNVRTAILTDRQLTFVVCVPQFLLGALHVLASSTLRYSHC